MQVAGKIRLALAPHLNHWWQVPLYVTARGLITSPIWLAGRSFQIDFNFVDYQRVIACSDRISAGFNFAPCAIADIYRSVIKALAKLVIEVRIGTMLVVIPEAVSFGQDRIHVFYDRDYVRQFWRFLVQCDRVFEKLRAFPR